MIGNVGWRNHYRGVVCVGICSPERVVEMDLGWGRKRKGEGHTGML